jgi:hypothetical protein
MHPYPPIQDTDTFSKPFRWPQAGAANLDRVKQALWDAFPGTAEPVPAEHPNGGFARVAPPVAPSLPINLDEAAQQTVVTGHEAASDDPPENVVPITEQQQADSYVQLAELAACDPDVKALLYFPLIDDPGLSGGFQSGSLFADLADKVSYSDLKAKIASASGLCQGGVPGIAQGWAHTTSVLGAQGLFGVPGTGSQPARKLAASLGAWSTINVAEDANYVARLVRAPGGPVGTPLVGIAKAYSSPRLHFPNLKAGRYRLRIVLRAATNTGRTTTLTSQPFTVGAQPKGT